MKFLTLVRHAAAVHDSSYRDFDRPLRKKGIEKASFNAAKIAGLEYCADMLISSPAARALETAEIFAGESGCGISPDDITVDETLYLPSPGDILECVQAVADEYQDVFLFSHNNGISWAAQQFSGDGSILMPTGALIRLELNIESWKDAVFGCGKLADFLP